MNLTVGYIPFTINPNLLHSYTDNLSPNLIMKVFYELKLNLRDFYSNGMMP